MTRNGNGVHIAERPVEPLDYLLARGIEHPTADQIAEAEQTIYEAEQLGDEVLMPGPVLRNLSTVKPEPIKWMIPNKIPLGKVGVFFGDPGCGKTAVLIDAISRLSKGATWMDGSRNDIGPAHSIFMSTEDDAADTIVPRAIAAGADLSKITMLDAIRMPGEKGAVVERSFTLEYTSYLRDAIKQTGAKLVGIDPVSAHCGAVDSHKNSDVRGMLAPLQKLAGQLGCAIILISHMNKAGGGNALYRASGSLAFVAAARSAWLFTKDKNDPRRRLMLPAKNNVGPDSSGLAYSIMDSDGAAVVAWEPDPVTIGADEALAASTERDKPGPEAEQLEAAEIWLAGLMANGELLVEKIKEEAGAAGMAWRTVHRAKDSLGIIPYRQGFSGAWAWRLPVTNQRCQP